MKSLGPKAVRTRSCSCVCMLRVSNLGTTPRPSCCILFRRTGRLPATSSGCRYDKAGVWLERMLQNEARIVPWQSQHFAVAARRCCCPSGCGRACKVIAITRCSVNHSYGAHRDTFAPRCVRLLRNCSLKSNSFRDSSSVANVNNSRDRKLLTWFPKKVRFDTENNSHDRHACWQIPSARSG